LRKNLHSTEEEIESVSTCNQAKDSVFDEIKWVYEHSFFQERESFLRARRRE